MPFYRVGGIVAHIHMSARQRKKAAPPCPFWVWSYSGVDGRRGERVRCMAPAGYLCDWLGCNSPICHAHAQQLVAGFDFCPHHNAQRGLLSRLLPAPTENP